MIRRLIEEAGRPLGVKELIRLGSIHPGQQTALKRVLRDLVKAGHLEKEGKRFSPARERRPAPEENGQRRRGVSARIEGILHLHPDGFGFVHPLTGEGENVFLPAEQARRAMDHDRVIVDVMPGPRGLSGRLVKVLERRRQMVVGVYRERRGKAHVEPLDDKVAGPILVPPTQLARDGDRVKVRLGVGALLLEDGAGLKGEVAGSFGNKGDSSVEVLSIAYSHGFHEEFPAEVMDEADTFPLVPSPAEWQGRRDLRSMPLLTIDGEDARDFDDAIYVEESAHGFRLVVAIADVSHYVKEGSALDVEALRRATSVYLPGRVLPMLPERLSNGLCSLKPDEDRLCMVCDMELDTSGALKKTDLYPAVMRSVARCTYNEVHRVLAGEDLPHRNRFKPVFEKALKLSRVLTAMRERRGAIDFDLPETRIELNEQGEPARMVRRDRLESHRLIEECMLAANEAVAKFFQELELPCVYRFHGEPDEDRLATFSALAKAYGFFLPAQSVSSRDLNELLEKLEGHPERRALNQLLLRSMMQAVYSSEQVGHFGLAAEHYLHFTSPIRRYPDLIVHRLLKSYWARRGQARSAQALDKEKSHLAKLAEQSSERERAAMEVERETVSFYACLLMKDRIGEVFDATVSGLSERGFFVELDGIFVEGMVRGDSVDARFRFDAHLHAMTFGQGRKVKVGQACRVRLQAVNIQKRQMDFALEGFPGAEAAPKKPGVPRPEPVRHADVWEDALPAPRAEGKSPHPGFDRLRALASRQGRKAAPPKASQKRPPGHADKRGSEKPRGGKPGGRKPPSSKRRR